MSELEALRQEAENLKNQIRVSIIFFYKVFFASSGCASKNRFELFSDKVFHFVFCYHVITAAGLCFSKRISETYKSITCLLGLFFVSQLPLLHRKIQDGYQNCRTGYFGSLLFVDQSSVF